MKLLATLSVFIMTFLGITRATTSTGENIIIEAKLIEITSEPNQPDDVEKVVAGLLDGLEVRREDGKPLFAVLGDSQYQVAMRRLSQRKRVDLMAAPRLVTPAGQKASIKVGREMTFPPEKKIPNLELGFTLDVMPERAANGLLDITVDSRLVEFEGLQRSASGIERPVLNERKAHDRVSMKPGETALIDLGSKIDTQRVEEEGADGKVIAAKTNRFTRRAIAFVTARTAEPARAKVAAAGFTTGKAVFRKGDDIRITQVQRGQGFLTVTADYELASAESASIALYVTSLTSSAAVKTDATQAKVVAKGKGTVVLHHPDLRDGLPHLSFYDLKTRKAFGCIYFGTKEEAEASRKLDLSYMTANEGEPSSSSTTRRDGAQQAITKLRAAPSQQYDFSKARLDDVLRYLATEAGLSFFSLPEDHPANDKVITFSIRASPFEVLETICRAYGLMLLPDGGIWYIRPADDRELIGKSYPQPATKSVGTEAILEDLQRIVGKGKEPKPTKPDGGFTPKVVFKASENAFYVVGTRLEHEWVSGYLKALSRVK